MRYTKEHEIKSNKEGDLLDKLVTRLAVLDNRVRSIEFKVFRREGAPLDKENGNGDHS